MEMCAIAAVAFWIAALVASPGKPRLGDEMQEFVYRRLLGRQHLLVLLASAVTALMVVALILSLPVRVHAEMELARLACQPTAEGYTKHCHPYEDARWQIAPVATAQCDAVDRRYPPC